VKTRKLVPSIFQHFSFFLDIFVKTTQMSHQYFSKSPQLLFFITEAEEGGFIAKAPQVGIYTQGETWDELLQNIKEAIHCHFDEGDAPKEFTWQMVKREVVVL
jgi:predicted RNase H-like HicB family nuclease